MPEPVAGFSEMYGTDRLHEAIADVEFVILTVPLTEETRHLFSTEAFDRMRSDTYVVNVARGPVVDTTALIDAIETGAIAGAALDVFETEPLPERSPLWDFENVIITPHAAALTRDYFREIGGLVEENVSRLEAGEVFHNRVV